MFAVAIKSYLRGERIRVSNVRREMTDTGLCMIMIK